MFWLSLYLFTVSVCGIICSVFVNKVKSIGYEYGQYLEFIYADSEKLMDSVDTFLNIIEQYNKNIFFNVIIPVYNIFVTIFFSRFCMTQLRVIKPLVDTLRLQKQALIDFADSIIEQLPDYCVVNGDDTLLVEHVNAILECMAEEDEEFEEDEKVTEYVQEDKDFLLRIVVNRYKEVKNVQ